MQASDELVGLMKTYAKMHVVENDVFSFTKSEYNQLEIVDTLSDDELQEVMEEILIEMSEEQDITEMVDALDALTITEVTSPAKVAALRAKNKASAAAGEGSGDAGAAARAKLSKPAASSGPSRMDRMKSAAKKAGSAIKSGAKAVAKGAARAAGYASGAAQRAASSAKSEFAKGRERGLKGSSSSSSSSSGSSSASTSTPSSSGSSSSGSSSSGSTRKAVGGALKSVGRLLKKGLKKGIGGAARAVSKGSDKLAKRMGEEAMTEADMTGAPSIKDAKPAKKTNVKYDPHMKVMAPQVKAEAVMGQDSEMRRAAAADRKRDSEKAHKNQKGVRQSEGQSKAYADYQLYTSRQKKNTTEGSDEFEMLIDFLVREGYSDSVDSATTMVSVMSEGWMNEVLELCYIQEGMEEYLVVMGEAETYDEAKELMGEMDEAALDILANQVQDIMDREDLEEKMGLYANIHAKRKRGGKMRKKGAAGAPTEQDFANAAKTAKEESVAVRKVIEGMRQARKDEIAEEGSDAMKDRRMERGGVDGNVRYDKAPKFAPGPSKKKKYDGMSVLDKVKADIRSKYGKGAVM